MYTNKQNIPIAVALFLATDNYDHSTVKNEVSVTTLIKPVRQILLQMRAGKLDEGLGDISDLLASRLGTAIHEGIERAWLNPVNALMKLGMDKDTAESVVINPPKGTDLTDKVPIYLETRTKKPLGNSVVSGAIDICIDGRLGDFKNTGTFMYTKKKSDAKYIEQGSIYRWLNPEMITEDEMSIYFIFKDWSRNKAMASDKYPPSPVQDYPLMLDSYEDTEKYLVAKLKSIEKFFDTPESELPLCPDKDLWMDESTYSYYAKPDSKRSSKNFNTDAAAAYSYKALKGVGVVKERKSEPKACLWCSAVKCSQRDSYVASGILKIRD